VPRSCPWEAALDPRLDSCAADRLRGAVDIYVNLDGTTDKDPEGFSGTPNNREGRAVLQSTREQGIQDLGR